MNRKFVLGLALLGLLALTGPANAVICTIDDVPAATLLLPYFEVDLGAADGVTTLFSINNASATAILAHVVVWSDLSVPVLDFNVYLTGYDVVTINMRDILTGSFPQTASVGQDPGDLISNKGQFSQDINFASCQDQLPILDVTGDLPNIRCPTLVITTQDNPLYPVEKMKAWQTRIPKSELLVIPSHSYHVAATAAQQCAKATLEFIERQRG